MAINTENKRRAVLRNLPVADSSIDQEDRAMITWNYFIEQGEQFFVHACIYSSDYLADTISKSDYLVNTFSVVEVECL